MVQKYRIVVSHVRFSDRDMMNINGVDDMVWIRWHEKLLLKITGFKDEKK
jgi:hypothetical protein